MVLELEKNFHIPYVQFPLYHLTWEEYIITMNELVLIHYYQLKSICFHGSLVFTWCLFCDFRIPSRWPHDTSLSCPRVSLGSSCLWQFLRLSWHFWTIPGMQKCVCVCVCACGHHMQSQKQSITNKIEAPCVPILLSFLFQRQPVSSIWCFCPLHALKQLYLVLLCIF